MPSLPSCQSTPGAVVERGVRGAVRRDVVVIARVADRTCTSLHEWRDAVRRIRLEWKTELQVAVVQPHADVVEVQVLAVPEVFSNVNFELE
jgi:hypothetical protein